MDEFIDNLEKIIVKHSNREEEFGFQMGGYPYVLVMSFGLLKICDCALKHSDNDFVIQKYFQGHDLIEVLTSIPNSFDNNIYINNIFDLEKLKHFDMDLMGYFHRRNDSARKSIFPEDISFKNRSRLDILNNMIRYNEDVYGHILKEFPKKELRTSVSMRNRYNNDLCSDFLREEDVFVFLKNYLGTLDDFFRNFLYHMNFEWGIYVLKEYFSLSDIIKDLSNIDIPEKNFLSINTFSETIKEFIKSYYERYSKLSNEEEFDLRELLVNLLFTDITLDDYSEINICDPNYFSKETLDKSKEYIYSKNNKCKVNLYKIIDSHAYYKPNIDSGVILSIYLESLLLDGNDSVYRSDVMDFSAFNNSNHLDFDFIISDYRSKDISKEIGLIHQFQDKLDKRSKLVMIIDNNQFYNKSINWMIKNDNLEAVLVFYDCFILIANSDKSIKRKNKFILIDYTILSKLYGDDTEYVKKGKNLVVSKYRYSKDNISKMLNVYRDFEDSEFSKVIDNKTVVKNFVYDELDKYWGDYYENNLKRLLVCYKDDEWDILKVHNMHLENVPNAVLEKSKEYFECNYPLDHKKIRIKDFNNSYENYYGVSKNFKENEVESRNLINIEFHLKDFNYNNLMHDKKRERYTISKQKRLSGNKSEIVEKLIRSIPLYKLITFNPLEVDESKIEERKIELFDKIFYLKSDKFLRKFIILFLESGKGIAEYNFFKHSRLCSSKKDFIYIRVPDIPLETQEKIIKVYELNEEHYKFVKQCRDNFKEDILDYEKLEKDMEEINKMEIDINTGMIKKMTPAKRHLFDGLLWPLSISYLNAVHGTHGDNPNEQLDFHLKLFEFLAAFIDIVLVSAMPKEEYDKLKKELWNGVFFNKSNNDENKKLYKHNYRYLGDFGTWTTLYKKLLKCYEKYNISPIFNNDLIESFLDYEIFEIIDLAREIRNKYPAHGSGVSQSLAKQLMEDLKEKIDFVYEIFGYLNGFKLYYCEEDKCTPIDNNYKYNVVSLNGPCDQPIYGEITFNKLLKKDTLYLFNSLNGDLLELNKNLIIFEEAIDMYEEFDKNGEKHIKTRPSGRYYLYVFNGFNKRKKKYKVNYKCHQIYTTEKVKDFSFEKWQEILPID